MTITNARDETDDIASVSGLHTKHVAPTAQDAAPAREPPRARSTSAIERAAIAPETQLRAGPPAPALRRNPLLALIHDGLDRDILAEVQTGMSDALADSELALVLQPITADVAAARLSAFLKRYRPAGIVLLPSLAEREDLAGLCSAGKVACVRIGPRRGYLAAAQHGLLCDERGAAVQLTAWLIGHGHRRIGFVAGPEDLLSARQRELGYLDAMADNGLDRGPALIVAGDNSFASGIEAGRLLLEISPRPSAILASNDEMALGVLHAAAQMGVTVPADLSVAGFNDTAPARRAVPPLTTMRIPWSTMGREAAQTIRQGGHSGPDVLFKTELVVRSSVAPLT
ncbi:LacI family transcription regulator [Novosphingobium barchaimii LL02]|uniref:LacI family transcription regulator n=1 Tax=Novosphingobium barchaimii LL02 TaxID=1114963 RepID=A0A0J7YAH3_9SPHN|nr:substrate-binding domain-containing protein [Novosphingobium barchaimii]KMS60343.1 LacI family transcription regulator [Novosphingobium barchaimii LL02]